MIMKGTLLTMLACVVITGSAFSQNAADVLENGIRVKDYHKIFLGLDPVKNIIKTDIGIEPANPLTYRDSTLYLVSQVGVNVYMHPVNPLKGTHKATLIVIDDPVDDAAKKEIESILEFIDPFISTKEAEQRKGKIIDSWEQYKSDLAQINPKVEPIANSLKNDYKKEMGEAFTMLSGLSFRNEQSTIDSLNIIDARIDTIRSHFERLEKTITDAKDTIKTLSAPLNHIYDIVMRDLEKIKTGQEKHLNKLQQVYDLVKEYQKEASNGVDGVTWIVKLGEIPANRGKISEYTVRLDKGIYRLDGKSNEIKEVSSEELVSHVLRVRKFQRFVPEVVAGVAYTFITHPVYGTETDDQGQQYVAESGENELNNINFTAMVNFNYYCDNSPLHFFWQIGAGINKEIPSLLSGGGVRVNIGGARLALSGGLALTLVKQLDKLSIGDEISGTAELEKDLKYRAVWPPRPYAGIQIKF